MEVSKVKASKDKVWEVASDPESILKFDSETKSVKILKREGNTYTATTTSTMGGKEVVITSKWTLHPKQKLEEKILEGPIIGKGTQTLVEVPEETKITWAYDISIKGVLEKILGSLFAGSKLREYEENLLRNMAKYVEAKK